MKELRIQRVMLGIIGFGLLVVGGVLFWELLPGAREAGGMMFKAGMGLVAIWLAIPQLVEIIARGGKGWWIAAGGGLACLVFPRAMVFVLPLIVGMLVLQFVGWLFKPMK